MASGGGGHPTEGLGEAIVEGHQRLGERLRHWRHEESGGSHDEVAPGQEVREHHPERVGEVRHEVPTGQAGSGRLRQQGRRAHPGDGATVAGPSGRPDGDKAARRHHAEDGLRVYITLTGQHVGRVEAGGQGSGAVHRPVGPGRSANGHGGTHSDMRDLPAGRGTDVFGGTDGPAGGPAGIEVDRYLEKSFCKVLPWEVIHQNFPVRTASKLALILKQKPDGTTKRRIVIDLRRSGGNARAEVPERIVLPRAWDVVQSARFMKEHEKEVPEVMAGAIFEEDAEFMLLDLKDAFCHFELHPKELCHAVSPGLESGTGILWCAMLFGYTAAPLIMGRLSAAIARLVQSTLHPAEGQTQMYVDDLLLLLRGSKSQRELILAMVIHTLAAFGVQLSLDKGERGIRCTWIGTTFELRHNKIVLSTPKKLLDEVQTKLDEWAKAGMLSVKEMKSVAGKLSWIAGITPRIRWAVTAIYAVIASVERDEASGQEFIRAAKRDGDRRPKQGLAHRKRLGTALPWLRAALQAPHLYLIREEELQEATASWGMVTDASPRGLGGILIQRIASSGSWWKPSSPWSRRSRPRSSGWSGRAPWKPWPSSAAYSAGDHGCDPARSSSDPIAVSRWRCSRSYPVRRRH